MPFREPFDAALRFWPPKPGKQIDVLTVGQINIEQGSHVLLSLALDARSRGLPIRYHLVGTSDLAVALSDTLVDVTDLDLAAHDIFDQIERLQPACIFVPSIWPETHCAAISVAQALDIPPVVFDIGAQAERVRSTNYGYILPYHLADDIMALNDRRCSLQYDAGVYQRA